MAAGRKSRRKLPKASVRYRRARPGSPRRCATCSMFRPPDSCTLVAGKIRGGDVCDRWAPK